MYVCICNAVTEQLIREEVMSGVTEIKTLIQRFDVGSGCATCVTALRDVMHSAIHELQTASNEAMDGLSCLQQPAMAFDTAAIERLAYRAA